MFVYFACHCYSYKTDNEAHISSAVKLETSKRTFAGLMPAETLHDLDISSVDWSRPLLSTPKKGRDVCARNGRKPVHVKKIYPVASHDHQA